MARTWNAVWFLWRLWLVCFNRRTNVDEVNGTKRIIRLCARWFVASTSYSIILDTGAIVVVIGWSVVLDLCRLRDWFPCREIKEGWKNLFLCRCLYWLSSPTLLVTRRLKAFTTPFPSSAVWRIMLWWFTLLLSVMGGRVIRSSRPVDWLWKSTATTGLSWNGYEPAFGWIVCVRLLPVDLFCSEWAMSWWCLQSVTRLVRFVVGSLGQRCLEALVWSLHAAYMCIPLSLLLRGLLDNPFASHLTCCTCCGGGFGGLILALITCHHGTYRPCYL